MITSKEILNLKSTRINFNEKLNYSGVSIDSRNVKKGEIFFAIKGENLDGHNYVDSVIKNKKAALIFVNKNWFRKNKNKYKKQSFIVVDDTIKSLGELASIHRDKMNIPVLAVAGSNGKTTTKDLISSVLSQKFNVLKTNGNFNNHIGLPLTLLRIEDKHNFCVLETGSNHFGELKYLCEIAKPDFALVTNIGKEHLEFFKNLNGVAKEEFTVFDWVKKNGSVCFYNLDDEYIRKYYSNNKQKSLTYSYNYSSDFRAKMNGLDKDFKPEILLKYNGKIIKIKINTFGLHSFYNGLAAITIGIYFGVNINKIKKALGNYQNASEKRMEIKDINYIKVINDSYNSNPDSVKLGLETIAKFNSKGKKHIILSDMLEMGKSAKVEHYKIGEILSKMKIDYLYTYGENSKETFKGAKKLNNNFYFEDKIELANFVKLNVKKGDVIYVKGSRGMKMEEILDEIFFNNQKNI